MFDSGEPSLLFALDDNVRGLKRSRVRETHPYSDCPELLSLRTQWRNHVAVRLARGPGAGKYDVRIRRRRVNVQCDLHEENLIARELPENGAVVVIDDDAVVGQEIEVKETRRVGYWLVEGFELDRCDVVGVALGHE